MKRKSIVTYFLLALITTFLVIFVLVFLLKKDNDDIKIVKSERELIKLVKNSSDVSIPQLLLMLPYSVFYNSYNRFYPYDSDVRVKDDIATNSVNSETWIKGDSSSKTTSTNTDYSKTNIQVENVDEADIVKTDGDYLYSVVDDKIAITKVENNGDFEVVSNISNIGTPNDILINENKLIVISENYNSKHDYTQIDVFDISDRENPKKIKKISTSFKYYTSRMIGNNVYIFASGYLDLNDDKKIESIYSIDDKKQNVEFEKISYINNNESYKMTEILSFDLNNLNDIEFNGMLMDINNAYISEKNIYILNNKYETKSSSSDPQIKDLFGFKGIFGVFDVEYEDSYGRYTNIYKFEIDGKDVKYVAKNKEKGTTLNQFSMDEFNDNLRITLNDGNNENKLCVYDKNLKKIGEIKDIAPGEKIYSTRFVKDRAYMVTYRTIDPLFVIDLSDPTNPEILGELKIPGYSTYLHPYDDNHIIGIGNDTKTTISRNAEGRVTSERTVITGMKMAIFDVTDVSNPKELFNTKIGDSRTYSSILTNHKALLFSKEKGILGIPINNYNLDISINVTSDNISDSDISKRISSNRTKSGYLVYDIDLTNGFKEKGTITHDSSDYYSYSKEGVRGVYINDILYTLSNKYIKSNNLKDLKEIKSLKLN